MTAVPTTTLRMGPLWRTPTPRGPDARLGRPIRHRPVRGGFRCAAGDPAYRDRHASSASATGPRGLHVPGARPHRRRADGPVAGLGVHDLLPHRAAQPPPPAPGGLAADPDRAGLGLPGHPGPARRLRHGVRAPAAGQALRGLPAVVRAPGGRFAGGHAGAGVDRRPGGLLAADGVLGHRQRRGVVRLRVRVHQGPLRVRLGGHRCARRAHRGEAAGHQGRLVARRGRGRPRSRVVGRSWRVRSGWRPARWC